MQPDSGNLWVSIRYIVMDRVDFTGISLAGAQLYSGQKAKKPGGKSELKGSKRVFFSELLGNSAPLDGLGPLRELAPSEEALAELMDEVYSAGSDLKDRPYSEEILRYKRAIRNFVNYIIENGYELYKSHGIKRKTHMHGEAEWKTNIYCQVQVIDKKLEELVASVMSGQINHLKNVSKIDEITGLLVDLTIKGVIRERDE